MDGSSPSNSIINIATASAAVVMVATALFMQKSRKEPPQKAQKDAPGDGSRLNERKRNIAKDEESWESHVKGHGSLREIWPGILFVLEADGCNRGPPIRNMIIYRIPAETNNEIKEMTDNDEKENNQHQQRQLLIYNAIAVREETLQEIVSLGSPTVMVVPNYLHRCCAAVWKKRFPDLQVVCPENARQSVTEVVSVDMSIDALTQTEHWCKWVHSKVIDGWGDFENVIEVELEDVQSLNNSGKKAMIVCDLLFTVPLKKNASYGERFLIWLFDSSIQLPVDGSIIVPKVARLSRIFAIKDWSKAEKWYRDYAAEYGKQIACILVGHGPPVMEVQRSEGCTKAFEGVADQLRKPRW